MSIKAFENVYYPTWDVLKLCYFSLFRTLIEAKKQMPVSNWTKDIRKMKAYSKNPWLVENIDDFNFLCCPECAYKSKGRVDLVMDYSSIFWSKGQAAF